MITKNFIEAKQNSKEHTNEEIKGFITGLSKFTQEEITQWLKAVKENGLSDNETTTLTLEMANSGLTLNWQGLEPTIDKHSSGGIGDKVTLLVTPLIAAYGINVPKLSGRGLGIWGGTIDKLESIPSFKVNLSINEMKEQVKKIKIAISAATNDLAPADKKIYAIRDVTNTVDVLPLIVSSIMSKKIACGAKNIILDVKTGSGALMKTLDEAKELAEKMVIIGRNLNKTTKAVITDMNEPLGYMIGNALEIREVLEILSGKEVSDLVEIVICLAKEAIQEVENSPPSEEKLRHLLLGGESLKKFEEMVKYQNGDITKLPKAKWVELVKCNKDGYIHKIDANIVGQEVFNLGSGRKLVQDTIDYSAGVILLKKHGDTVNKDEPLFEIHAKSKEEAESVKDKLISAVKIEDSKPNKLKLIHEVI